MNEEELLKSILVDIETIKNLNWQGKYIPAYGKLLGLRQRLNQKLSNCVKSKDEKKSGDK